MKKAGLGTAGLAALMNSVSAQYFIRDDSFSVETGTGPDDLGTYFSVGQHGPVEVEGTDLLLNENDLDDVKIVGSGKGQYINRQADSGEDEDNTISRGERQLFTKILKT